MKKSIINPAQFGSVIAALFLWVFLSPNPIHAKAEGSANAMIPMVCHDLVHISLDESCFAELTPETVLQDMQGEASEYYIEVSKNGIKRPGTTFGSADVRQFFDYKIWHLPSRNSCWGKVYIEDKLAPVIECGLDTVRCRDRYDVLVLGLPIPDVYVTMNVAVQWDSSNKNLIVPVKWYIYGWDACGVVSLTYRDRLDYYGCDSFCFKRVFREWTAVDPSGNTARCIDTICIRRPDLSDVVIPRDFDGFDLPYLVCTDSFPVLPDGNPSPEYTGYPVSNQCNTLIAEFKDIRLDVCGKTFKVIRRWTILDWCTRRIIEHTQLIKIVDEEGPEFDVPEDFTVGMTPWTCGSYGKIPPPSNVTDCGDWTYEIFTVLADPITGNPGLRGTDYIRYNKNEKCYYLVGAPEGRIWVEYVLTDDCGNESTQRIEIGVVDNLMPVAICDQKTVVTLTSDGTAKAFAETFDDGSIDNCGIEGFRVRRMDDPCNNNTDEFGPFVGFCCEDVGKTIMVVLEVSDHSRNKNTCMVEVVVQEKEPPVVIAPTDLTISCNYDRFDFSKFGVVRRNQADREDLYIKDYYYSQSNYYAGIDGYAYDNCHYTLTETVLDSIKCNQGKIWRIFTATDRQGYVTRDTQTITILNPDPFWIDQSNYYSDKDDVIWPNESVKVFSCRAADLSPDNTGKPEFINTHCAQIMVNYKDTRLNLLDSVCYKILRKWTVIDWCQFDVRSQFGIWEYTQVILVTNNIPPDIFTCTDTTICDYNSFRDIRSGKCLANYDMNAWGEDDCTYPEDILWSYRIDENNDGSFDTIVPGRHALGILPVGTHRIRWIASDQCGNVSQCDRIFTLIDCKKPTPYCLTGINTVIMPSSGMIEVWAKDLDLGSFDNCTSRDQLKYSFTADTSDKSMIFTCDSLKGEAFITFTVRMYVTDEQGNQDYCETTVRIQDNNNSCGTNLTGVGGQLKRANQSFIPDARIHVMDDADLEISFIESDINGNYAFQPLPSDRTAYFTVTREDLAGNGVSTLDIIMIQKHILGQKQLGSAYEILAADVNRSNSVTARDIAEIRKIILGISEEYSSERIWMFVPSSQNFSNPAAPWEFRERIRTEEIQNNQWNLLNFTGIKLGDVDQSAKLSLHDRILSRSNKTIEFQLGNEVLSESESVMRVPVMASASFDLEGFQCSIELPEAAVMQIKTGLLDIRPEHYFQNSGSTLRISWAAQHVQKVNEGDVLFYLEFDKLVNTSSLRLTSHQVEPEIYLAGEEVATLELRALANPIVSKLDMSQNVPNPFQSTTQIRVWSDKPTVAQWSVMGSTGKLMIQRTVNLQAGEQYLELSRRDLPQAGIYLYRLESEFGTLVRKMIVID